MPKKPFSSISLFKAWMFGLAFSATAVVIGIVITSLVYEERLSGPAFWLPVDMAMVLWVGALLSVVRDSVVARIDERADRCQLVQERLDEIELEHAEQPLPAASHNGGRRHLHPVE